MGKKKTKRQLLKRTYKRETEDSQLSLTKENFPEVDHQIIVVFAS
jgi:hypothetical protein